MAVENRVRAYRALKNNFTQQDLADAVGCSRQTVHSIESGKFVPSVELALKIAEALEVNVAEVFYLEGRQPGTVEKFKKKLA